MNSHPRADPNDAWGAHAAPGVAFARHQPPPNIVFLIAAIAADPTADPTDAPIDAPTDAPIDAATDVPTAAINPAPTAADALRRVFAAAHDERFAG